MAGRGSRVFVTLSGSSKGMKQNTWTSFICANPSLDSLSKIKHAVVYARIMQICIAACLPFKLPMQSAAAASQ